MSFPKHLLRTLGLVSAWALLVGCAHQERPVAPRGGSAPVGAVVGGTAGTHTAVVEVVTTARDGMVVYNRQPVGLAPQRISLPVTERGYLAEPVTVTVRFVARNVEEASTTRSVTLHPTDKAPQRLEFEPEAVRRVLARPE